MEGVCVENVVPCTSSLHGVAFINIKFHLPGEFPLGYRIQVSLQKGGIVLDFLILCHRIPLRKTSLRNFGNSVYPALPVSLGGDTKSRRLSLLSGVYARGSKRSHQSALACVTVVDSTTHSNPPPLFGHCGVLPYITQDKKIGR